MSPVEPEAGAAQLGADGWRRFVYFYGSACYLRIAFAQPPVNSSGDVLEKFRREGVFHLYYIDDIGITYRAVQTVAFKRGNVGQFQSYGIFKIIPDDFFLFAYTVMPEQDEVFNYNGSSHCACQYLFVLRRFLPGFSGCFGFGRALSCAIVFGGFFSSTRAKSSWRFWRSARATCTVILSPRR